jgi:hypothetical protein
MKLVDIDAQRTLNEWNSLSSSSTSTPPFRGGAIIVNPHNGYVSHSVTYSIHLFHIINCILHQLLFDFKGHI